MLEIEPRASCMLDKVCLPEPHPEPQGGVLIGHPKLQCHIWQVGVTCSLACTGYLLGVTIREGQLGRDMEHDLPVPESGVH